MNQERRTTLLGSIVGATSESARICAAALEASCPPYQRLLLEQVREDRRVLLIDLVQSLLLAGLPEAQVHRAMTRALAPAQLGPAQTVDLVDLELNERKLAFGLRAVLAEASTDEAILELLSVHYLRLRMRLRELDALTSDLPHGLGFPAEAPLLLN